MFDFLVQSLAAGLLFYGLWTTGDTRLRGPATCFMAEIFTTIVGVTHHTWSIVLIGGVLFFVQLRNFLKWRAEGVKW
jgi:hypothetical protein